MILSFFQTSDRLNSPEIWILAFRAKAFLFQTHREICMAIWHIAYNAIQLTDGDCSIASSVPNQTLLVTSAFDFQSYYMPSLAEYLAPLSTPSDAVVNEQNVYVWGNPWLMWTFTTTVQHRLPQKHPCQTLRFPSQSLHVSACSISTIPISSILANRWWRKVIKRSISLKTPHDQSTESRALTGKRNI